MNIRTFYMRVLVIPTLLGIVAFVSAADRQPMVVLQEGIDQGLTLLSDESYRNANNRAEQEARLRALTMTFFDFTAMSRMVLSSHWKHFTGEQQTAFVQAFTAFLQRRYLPILLDRYNGEQVEFLREVRLSPSRARVEARVRHRGKAIPVDIKMIRRKGKWRVYDVDALGFSAVANYRAQFEWLLQSETPTQVIERLQRGAGALP
jgi:ABC-type transporter MlaC component